MACRPSDINVTAGDGSGPEGPESSRALVMGDLEKIVTIRVFEEHLLELFSRGELMGTTHTSIGQEANAVGIASVLHPDDVIVSNHRGHAHFLSHIGNMDGLMAEIMGRESGVCGGWGGSQQLWARDAFYSHGVQGGTASLGAGIGLAEKFKGTGRIAVVFLGDGTLGQGVLYESFNLASIWKIPVLFVIEDNQIAQTTPSRLTVAGSVIDRARAFGIRTAELTYPSVPKVRQTASEAVRYIRSKQQPFCLVIRTYRFAPHSKGDDTRAPEEIESHRKFDPLRDFREICTGPQLRDIEERAHQRVERAYRKAADAPLARLQDEPQETPAGRLRVEVPRISEQRSSGILKEAASGTMRDQLNRALHEIFETCPETYLIGQDLLDPYGGAFKVTAGLSSRYPDRVLPSPISENAMVGLAGGMALRGLRPIVEIMFGDFLTLCMDPLVNYISKYAQMYGNQVSVPLVVRTPMGGRRGYGPTHSQTLDKHFLGVPGLEVLAPSPVHPAGRMLQAAVLKDSPVLFLENKACYATRPKVAEECMVDDFFVYFAGDAEAPIACLSLTQFEDETATLVCYGGTLPTAMEAAVRLLTESETSVRILVPARLYPLEVERIGGLMVPGAPILTAEEGVLAGGFGAELCAALTERFPGQMGRFSRIGARDLPVAAARSLEDSILPQVEEIVRGMRALTGPGQQDRGL